MTKIKANQLEIREILNDPTAQASETWKGTLEIATQAEVNSGSPYDNTRAITPQTLAGFGGLPNNWLIANNDVDFSPAPTAAGSNSIAIGRSADAKSLHDISIGNTAKSLSGVNNITIGAYTNSLGGGCLTIGASAETSGLHAIAIGFTTKATSESALAIGDTSTADQTFQIVIGADITATSAPTNPPYAVKLGYGTTTNKNLLFLHDKGKLELVGDEAQVIMPNYAPTGSPATALPSTTNQGGTIYDFDTKTLKFYNGTAWTELNSQNWLTANAGDNFTTPPVATGLFSIALGDNATATALNTISIGRNADATTNASNAVAIGLNSTADGSSSIAIGNGADSGSISSGTTVAIGSTASALKTAQISIGQNVSAASVTPTDVNFSVKIGYGVASADKNMLHLFSKGKLELYGDEAQFIMPNYAVTGSPVDVPANSVEGGVIYDSAAQGLKVYDGASWSVVGAANNWLTANSGVNFITPPTALFSNSIALGNNSTSVANESISIGSNTRGELNSVTLGLNSGAYAQSCISIGSGTKAGTVSETSCIAMGLATQARKLSQVSIGTSISTTSVTPTDVQYSVKLGFGHSTSPDRNMLHLFSKGKLELYGTEAQFIMPNYVVTGSPFDVPAVGVEGGVIYDSVAKGLQLYDGASWSAVGGGTPGGSDKQIQYNNAGVFGGASHFTYNVATGGMFMTRAGVISNDEVLRVTNSSGAAFSYAIEAISSGTSATVGIRSTSNSTNGIGLNAVCNAANGKGIYAQVAASDSIAGYFENTDGTDTEVSVALGSDLILGSVDGTEKFHIDDTGEANFVGNVISHIAINAQIGLTYTLVLTDDGKLVTMDNGSANELTIPTNASVAFPVGTQILVEQEGAGTTTIVAVGSPPVPTINSAGGLLDCATQYSTLTLIKKAADIWLLTGDLA